MNKGKSYYNYRIEQYTKEINKLDKSFTVLALFRAIVFFIVLIGSYYIMKNIDVIYGIIFAVISMGLFIYLIFLCNEIKHKINRANEYIKINRNGLLRIDGKWKDFEDTGNEYLDVNNSYINDLDIFGKGSLFQLINNCKSKFGRKILVNNLKLINKTNIDELKLKQDSIKELAEKPDFRQNLMVEGTLKKAGVRDVSDLILWAGQSKKYPISKMYIAYFFVFCTMISFLLVILNILQINILILQLIINFIVIKWLSKDLRNTIELFINHKEDIEAYKNMLDVIVKEEFNCEYNKKTQNILKWSDKKNSVKELNKLKQIVDWMGDSHSNPYYLIINLIMFSDVFIIHNLYKWRENNGRQFEKWLNSMGEFEALSSISNLYFDFDDWCVPEVVNEDIVKGKSIGHPLLYNKATVNDYSLCGKQKATIITGSNMSGKSTFLRTIGLNLILAYIGGPTFAKEFVCGKFNVYTCMRTADNLEENISSFYAEILRIKLLIESSKKGEKIFFLLDEIFKGTNSDDRHEGAKVLINQLINNGAVGLVSTHDFELCDLQENDKRIENYNFREYYEEDKIKFDYKLRKGKSTTKNAIHLMKLAGIDFDKNK